MKRLSQALVALFLACGVHAETKDNNCLAELDGSSQTQATSEVIVWVNENGDILRTETNRLTLATTAQGNTPTTIPHVSISNPEPETRISSTQTVIHHETVTLDQPAATERIEKKVPPHPHAHPPLPPPAPAPPPPPAPLAVPPAPPAPDASLLLPPHPDPHPGPHPEEDHHPHPAPHTEKRRFGISYSPYNANRSCKTQDEVHKDFNQLSEYAYVRIYGIDCGQAKTVATAARFHKMQVFAGLYDLTDFPNSLSAFEDAATTPDGKKDWSIFHTIAVGNELVNGGKVAPGKVAGAVNQARTTLRGKGYQGPVVTVDTFSILLKHPELCKASDYCAANCHAFFDATQQPHNAGPYALEQAHAVSDVAGGKRTMITESGWPHAGEANGAAVPSQENQRIAVESLQRSFAHRSQDLVLFTAFDDLWKQDNRYTFNAERFWGIYDK